MSASILKEPFSFRMIPADVDQHLMPIAQIVSDAFAGGEYVEEISQTYIGNCHYDFDSTRLIYAGDELVHHWGVWGYAMRMESVQLNVAGIGAVFTREPHRKQGLMTKAAADSIGALKENGYDLSILRGRHYVKYGYVRAWNYVTYILKPEEIPEYVINPEYTLLTKDHLDDVVELYNNTHQKFTGTAMRPTYRFIDSDLGIYGWFDKGGTLTGYVRAIPTDDKKALQCLEATGEPEIGLAVLRDLFENGEYETLNFYTIPHLHPILQFLRRGAFIVEDRYFKDTGWRVKVINLESSLGKLQPLFERRLKRSHFKDWRGELHIDAGDQNANLLIDNGNVQVTEPTQSENSVQGGPAIARFLIGSDEPGEIIQQEEIACMGAAEDLVTVLFPNLYPMMSHWDEY
ncbi:MAG: GNAT family N-acetyltransferase [Anaerolineales bacterium]|nr:GNAT family N-acetyltransferase [Chloroflexota bacterium]MBL6981801.1 GNAT family N-acetyltransferase [Anaerolineales bacterium]